VIRSCKLGEARLLTGAVSLEKEGSKEDERRRRAKEYGHVINSKCWQNKGLNRKYFKIKCFIIKL
jgi:hypothetical protein